MTVSNSILSPQAISILEKRYLQRDDKDNIIETPEQLFRRIANAVAEGEKVDKEIWSDSFFDLMWSLEFLPNSPTIANAGTNKGCLSACFTCSPEEDSLESIMQTVNDWAMIEKWGGGVGIGLGNLRPKGDSIQTTHGKALGPIAVLDMLLNNARHITQGSFRQGAHMAQMPCLSGKTLINTVDGKKAIKDLVGTRPIIYCTDGKKIKTQIASRVWKSGEKELIRVWFDNDDYIDCTPDHKIMLSDGSYKEAQNLKMYDKINAFYKAFDNVGYKMIAMTLNNSTRRHYLALAEMKYRENLPKKGYNVHHLDHNKLNDSLDNLVLITRKEHGLLHQNSLNQERVRIANERKGRTIEEVYGVEIANRWKKNMSHIRTGRKPWNKGIKKEQYNIFYPNGFSNQFGHWPRKIIMCANCGINFYSGTSSGRKYCGKKCQLLSWKNGKKIYYAKPKIVTNHKVVRVEKLPGIHDVYDIEVPTYHNFVADDIFVHNCSHPDVFDFIHIKDNDDKFSNCNITVQVTDDFMNAVKNDEYWNLINPKNGKKTKTIKAKTLWKELCESAWKTGDPGIAFMDRVDESAPNPQLGKIVTSNPCSEEWLENYSNCCLASINLGKHTKKNEVDYKKLEQTVRLAVSFLDDVIEVNQFPIKKLKEMNLKTRRIGLGVMGWADMLVDLDIQYDSSEALELADKVGKFILDTAWDESRKLAKERGVFSEYENSALKDRLPFPVRHSSVITIAPTGTISRIANCSSGVEPFFSLAWWSNILWDNQDIKSSTRFLDAPAKLKEELRDKFKKSTAEEILSSIASDPKTGSEVLKKHGIKSSIYRSSFDISPEWHVKMQAAWQKNVTNGISKTINLPNEATVEDVEKAYWLAWESGCKAISLYRDGSKSQQVLETSTTKILKEEKTKKGRPRVVNGLTEKIATGHGNAYVTINFDKESKPLEVFTNLGKAGGCDLANLEAISRLASLAFRSGIETKEIIEQLKGITCCPIWDDGASIKSPVDALSKVLTKHVLKPEQEAKKEILKEKGIQLYSNGYNCIDCGGKVIQLEGCGQCQDCGYSRCD